MLMDQSSRDDTVVDVRPPGPAPRVAVSSQSSKDKRRKRSPGTFPMPEQGRAISGMRVTLAAEIYARPDVADATPFLSEVVEAVRLCRSVTAVSFGPGWSPRILTFEIWIGRALTPDHALLAAAKALRHGLRRTGLRTSVVARRGPLPPVRLRILGPTSIRPS